MLGRRMRKVRRRDAAVMPSRRAQQPPAAVYSASHPAPGYLSPRRPPTVHLAGPSSLAGNVDANHFSAAEVCVPPSARDASEFQSLYVPWPHHVFDLIRMWSKIHKFCILRRCSHVGSWSHIRTRKMHRSVVSLFYYVGKTVGMITGKYQLLQMNQRDALPHPPALCEHRGCMTLSVINSPRSSVE